MRIAIGGIMHESNSFSAKPTNLALFEEVGIAEGEDLRRVWGDSQHEIAGYLDDLDEAEIDTIPTLIAWATPSGMVEKAAVDELLNRVFHRLEGESFDGILFGLHGAMVLEGHEDGDGYILRRMRAQFGNEIPLISTLDFHANISDAMVELSDALVVYQTNPHVDQRSRGRRAASMMRRFIQGDVRPVQSMARHPMIFPILHQNTTHGPMKPLMDRLHELEARDDILAANLVAGFPYADVPEIGAVSLVVTDGDEALAQELSQQLADDLWALRDGLDTNLPDAAEAVRLANESEAEPIVLVEMGDNVGGGSAADSTFILAELVSQKSERSVVVIYDPESVKACVEAGIGGRVSLQAGGKTDDLHGAPVPITGSVRLFSDGKYEEREIRHGGRRFNDQGLTALVEYGEGNLLVLNSHRDPPMSLHQLLSLGIQPERFRILVVKAAIAYRAAYEPVLERIIEVDTPGTTTPNPKRLDYRNVPRPIFPLDEI
ncbi:MAG: M81 family metallopeptidase [Planctomycetota bacterium]|nr:M81 family metallopeptidase [Planctomycetota bacterium]MDP7255111.1 M81 family metallopeptidase [Planctomycetota bacterium]